jgi:hypothetical protein
VDTYNGNVMMEVSRPLSAREAFWFGEKAFQRREAFKSPGGTRDKYRMLRNRSFAEEQLWGSWQTVRWLFSHIISNEADHGGRAVLLGPMRVVGAERALRVP